MVSLMTFSLFILYFNTWNRGLYFSSSRNRKHLLRNKRQESSIKLHKVSNIFIKMVLFIVISSLRIQYFLMELVSYVISVGQLSAMAEGRHTVVLLITWHHKSYKVNNMTKQSTSGVQESQPTSFQSEKLLSTI